MVFFFNDTATTEIYTLSLHDALPILPWRRSDQGAPVAFSAKKLEEVFPIERSPRDAGNVVTMRIYQKDRKSTRLNSSHANISYAVFCLKKKKALLFCRCTTVGSMSRP